MDYSSLEDAELLLLLRKEHEDAFAEIYNRYWKLLYHTAYNIIQDQSIAQDIVQDVFIAVWQHRSTTEIRSLKAYLQQAVRFQVLKSIRAQKVDTLFYKRLAEVTADIIYENPLLVKEQETFIKYILESLPEDCRYVFMLSREEHLTYKQIANKLNISEKTVEKKMSISLKLIRIALQQNFSVSISLLIIYYLLS